MVIDAKTHLNILMSKLGPCLTTLKIQLQKWFIAIWLVINNKRIFSLQLAKEILSYTKDSYLCYSELRSL